MRIESTRILNGQGIHLALGEVTTADAGARVNRRGLFKDEVGLDKLANSLACAAESCEKRR